MTLTGKEVELIEEMKRYKVDILGVSEVKKRGSGSKRLTSGFTMIFSGINAGRAKEGVAIILKDELYDRIEKWEAVSSRIISMDLRLTMGKITCIQVYAPTDDKNVGEKDNFYHDLQRTVDLATSKNRSLVIMGDLNARTGQDRDMSHGVMGPWGGEPDINDNGHRLLDFCIANDLLVGNSFFNHKRIHKITFEAHGRPGASIIDYVIYSRDLRYFFTDVKVIRGAELGTDHHLLAADTKNLLPRKA